MLDGESESADTRSRSWASTPGVRASMRSNRGRDTSPELEIRRRLHSRGFRYRVSFRPIANIRRTADIVFTRQRVAVYIDGCFWHGCSEHYQAPVANGAFWAQKIATNTSRDRDTDSRLAAEGWRPLRFWEHEVRGDPETVVRTITEAVLRGGARRRHIRRTDGEPIS